MQPADANLAAGRPQAQFVPHLGSASDGGTGYDHACAGHAECPVNGQAKMSVFTARLHFSRLFEQVGAKRVDAFAGHAGHGKNRRTGQRPSFQQGFDLPLHFGDARWLDPVDLGKRHQGPANPQQLDDGQVLAGLRHHAVVCGDDQQHAVDTAGPGEHVVHEAFMTGDIDEAGQVGLTQRGVEVAEINGDAAQAFFLPTVAGLSGQCLEQGGFAVVDVPRGADDHDASACCRCESWASNAGSSSS